MIQGFIGWGQVDPGPESPEPARPASGTLIATGGRGCGRDVFQALAMYALLDRDYPPGQT